MMINCPNCGNPINYVKALDYVDQVIGEPHSGETVECSWVYCSFCNEDFKVVAKYKTDLIKLNVLEHVKEW